MKAPKRPSSPFRLLLQSLDFASKILDRDSVVGQLVFDFVEKMPQCRASIGCLGGLTDDPHGVPLSPSQVAPASFYIAFIHGRSHPLHATCYIGE